MSNAEGVALLMRVGGGCQKLQELLCAFMQNVFLADANADEDADEVCGWMPKMQANTRIYAHFTCLAWIYNPSKLPLGSNSRDSKNQFRPCQVLALFKNLSDTPIMIFLLRTSDR